MDCAVIVKRHSEETVAGRRMAFTDMSLTNFLILILGLEVLLFCWSFTAFFGSDSIFFFARRIVDPGQALASLSSVDDRGHYRPFTQLLFSYVLYPTFKLNHVGYHFVPLFFHFANTLLVFGILRRLLSQKIAVVAGTLFFGLHATNFFTTYSITFLPDFTFGFFYFGAVLSFLVYQEGHRRFWLVISFASFVLSLLCKEAAVTLPAILTLCSVARFRRAVPRRSDALPIWRRVIAPLAGHILILAAYLCFLGFIKQGEFYPRNSHDPYRASLSLSNLKQKTKYAWWALNLPSGIGQLKGHPRVMAQLGKLVPEPHLAYLGEISNLYVRPTRLLRLVLMIPLTVLFFAAVRARWRSEPMVAEGLIWFLIALSPVLLLASKTMRHNLYVPLVGVAAVMGIAAQLGTTLLRRRRPGMVRAASTCLFVMFFASSALGVYNNLRFSWPARASHVAQNSLSDLQSVHPVLPANATLYLVDNNDEETFFLFEGGNLFRVFYGSSKLNILFGSRGQALPANSLSDPSVFVLAYYNTHLYDLTKHYRDEAKDTRSYKLLDRFDPERVSVDEQEPYPVKGFFGSPGNKPAFRYYLARSRDCRPALVTLAGAKVRFEVPNVGPDSKLIIGAGMVHDLGDGALGSIRVDHNGVTDLLYSRYLDPARKIQDRRWFDEQISIGRYAPGPITLYFECSSGGSGDTGADWFAWSRMKICCTDD